ncbi:MAG: segregation and condensation protein [Actinomycetota bacterium]|jgi:segregation and condensation protein A|nr:segregation and condensation protein [Actinomycetota bacterium]
MPTEAAEPALDVASRCLVQTPVFEGPFDLLLHLILREQVDIYEISLSTIVDAYIAEMDRMRSSELTLDLDVATEFLLIAATLIDLKARRLLPGRDDIELDDELALWEERDVLLARLLECKTFKDAAKVLTLMSDDAGRSFPRRAGLDDAFIDLAPDLLANVTPPDLHAAFLRAVAPKPVPRVDLFHVTNIKANVSDAVAEMLDELPRVRRISFRRLTESLLDRIEIVVRFLAVLELFKQGLIDIEQSAAFGDIEIVWVGEGADEARALASIDVYDG